MSRTLYNLRLLADRPLRDKHLEVFLDSYGASIDAEPLCYRPTRQRGVDALWSDFVRIAHDTDRAFSVNTAARLPKHD